MRVLLVMVLLTLSSTAGVAGGPPSPNRCPMASNPLYALTRYCESLREEIHGQQKFCIYDCLTNKDAIMVMPDQSCPLVARQQLYGDGSSRLVMR